MRFELRLKLFRQDLQDLQDFLPVLSESDIAGYPEAPIMALPQSLTEEFNCYQRSGKSFSHAKTPGSKEDLTLIQHKFQQVTLGKTRLI